MSKSVSAARSAARRLTAAGAAAAALTVGGLVNAPTAAAHDSVIDAEPGLDATVAEFPRTITLEFSGEPRPNFNTLAVSDSETGEVLFTGEPKLERRFVSIDVPADVNPGPGDYTVGFQITSSDGHSTRGKTTFTVAGADGAAGKVDTDGAQDAAQDENAGPPTWMWWALGGIAALAVLGAAVVLLARNSTFSRKEN